MAMEKEARSGADKRPGEPDNGEAERVVPTHERNISRA
jgi:hypothetical protein